MFDNLLNLVKQHAGDAIINNSAIPNEKNDEAIHTTTTSIVDTLKSQVSGGNVNSIMDMFKSGNNTNVSNSLNTNVSSDLMKKFNLDQSAANNIVSSLLPNVMNSFVKKTNDPNDNSFDMKDVMNTLGGSNILGSLTNLF
jgi:hypothetical protein